ncbi:MAG: phosphohydrolase, partial [Prevotellaceae bacterium]|nr:phosphohydrolase [Prevotellaceae bacterium]
DQITEKRKLIAEHFDIDEADAHYFMSIDTVQKDMYDVNDDQISILFKDNTVKDISESSELLDISLLSKKIRKYYLCYQRF